MRVLVTGASGMLGPDILDVFEGQDIDVRGYDRDSCDITDRFQLKKIIEKEKPSHIINCAAYTNVDGAENDKEECFRVNTTGVENIVGLCKEKYIKLIQISTDYVFDGTKQSYDETERTDPINYYGYTKAEAEKIISERLSNYAIVRTSWLFGTHGINFVNKIIELAKKNESIKVVTDQVSSPTYTVDLATALVDVAKNESGIYHIRNEGTCSSYTYARTIVALAQLDCIVLPCEGDEYPQIAKRPAFSVLKNNKIPALRSWQEALQDYIHSITI